MRHSLRLFITVLLGCSCLGTASAAPQDVATPTPARFYRRVRLQWEALQRAAKNRAKHVVPVGGTAYLPLAELIRGQDEISIDNAFSKVPKMIEENELQWKADQKSWKLGADDGRSLISTDYPIDVVRGPDGYVIIDGHHDVFLSLYYGAKTIGVLVDEDLSYLSRTEFWLEMKKKQKVHLRASAEELANKTPAMWAAPDNAERYLAALLAMKIGMKPSGSSKKMSAKGSTNAVWVKLEASVPFIEFYIAQVLRENGIRYQRAWGSNVPDDVVAKARRAIANAQRQGRLPKNSIMPLIENKAVAERLLEKPERVSKLVARSTTPNACSLLLN